jgi:hypothetical protein
VRDEDHPQPTDNRAGPPPATDGVLRLTYDQIGGRLGMTADAARQLARRKGWPRTRPNHIGEPVVVSVPATELPDEQPPVHRRATDGELSDAQRTTGGEPTVADTEPPSVNRWSDLHAQALSALGNALAAANTRAEVALALADRLGAQLADAGKRADHAEARVAAAESDRRRADELVASLEADLRSKDAEIADQRNAAGEARAAAQEAHNAARRAEEQAEALQREEDVRKARGRLRRAWDGWRGR